MESTTLPYKNNYSVGDCFFRHHTWLKHIQSAINDYAQISEPTGECVNTDATTMIIMHLQFTAQMRSSKLPPWIDSQNG